MKLYYGPSSPYVRMARIAAMAKGISDGIELVNARTEHANYEELNFLNKVPALVTNGGEVLIESRLICQYLDGLADAPRLYPLEAAARWHTLQREALIHGVLDAVILRFNEARRAEGERSKWWDERQQKKIDLGLARIESNIAAYTAPNTILPISLGCLIDFMEHPDWALVYYNWRPDFPGIAEWFEAFAITSLMKETETIG
jgi:glutathione S-transferase